MVVRLCSGWLSPSPPLLLLQLLLLSLTSHSILPTHSLPIAINPLTNSSTTLLPPTDTDLPSISPAPTISQPPLPTTAALIGSAVNNITSPVIDSLSDTPVASILPTNVTDPSELLPNITALSNQTCQPIIPLFGVPITGGNCLGAVVDLPVCPVPNSNPQSGNNGFGEEQVQTPNGPMTTGQTTTINIPGLGTVTCGFTHGGSVKSCFSVPYASNTVRFAPATYPYAFGDFDATQQGPQCLQAGGGGVEDNCLWFEIHLPTTTPPAGGWPVFVYYPGGSFVNTAYNDMSKIVANTQNMIGIYGTYRVNVLGYMAIQGASKEQGCATGVEASGNWALLDMITGLHWIQDYITYLNGNPTKVTLGGESAGSWSCCELLASPLAKGLFQQIILESGTCDGGPAQLVPYLEHQEVLGQEIATRAGCALGQFNGDYVAQLACLRAKTAGELVVAMSDNGGLVTGLDRMTTSCVDGYVLPKPPQQLFWSGDFNAVPMLSGTNLFETTLFNFGYIENFPGTVQYTDGIPFIANFTDACAGNEQPNYVTGSCGADPQAVQAILARGGPTGTYSKYGQPLGPYYSLNDAADEGYFACGMRRLAQYTADAGKPSYSYNFRFRGSSGASVFYGPTHAFELPYAYDNANDLSRLDVEVGNTGTINGIAVGPSGFNPQESRFAQVISSYWTNFVMNGNPNDFTGNALASNGQSIMPIGYTWIPWPTYNRATDVALQLGEYTSVDNFTLWTNPFTGTSASPYEAACGTFQFCAAWDRLVPGWDNHNAVLFTPRTFTGYSAAGFTSGSCSSISGTYFTANGEKTYGNSSSGSNSTTPTTAAPTNTTVPTTSAPQTTSPATNTQLPTTAAASTTAVSTTRAPQTTSPTSTSEAPTNAVGTSASATTAALTSSATPSPSSTTTATTFSTPTSSTSSATTRASSSSPAATAQSSITPTTSSSSAVSGTTTSTTQPATGQSSSSSNSNTAQPTSTTVTSSAPPVTQSASVPSSTTTTSLTTPGTSITGGVSPVIISTTSTVPSSTVPGSSTSISGTVPTGFSSVSSVPSATSQVASTSATTIVSPVVATPASTVSSSAVPSSTTSVSGSGSTTPSASSMPSTTAQVISASGTTGVASAANTISNTSPVCVSNVLPCGTGGLYYSPTSSYTCVNGNLISTTSSASGSSSSNTPATGQLISSQSSTTSTGSNQQSFICPTTAAFTAPVGPVSAFTGQSVSSSSGATAPSTAYVTATGQSTTPTIQPRQSTCNGVSLQCPVQYDGPRAPAGTQDYVCYVYDPARSESPWAGSQFSYPQCYNPDEHICTSTYLLCPVAQPLACGRACFDPAVSQCVIQDVNNFYSSSRLQPLRSTTTGTSKKVDSFPRLYAQALERRAGKQ